VKVDGSFRIALFVGLLLLKLTFLLDIAVKSERVAQPDNAVVQSNRYSKQYFFI
jgi:hypothetical protein